MRRSTLIAADELSDGIQESTKNGADAKIYIRADTRAKYGDVKHVLAKLGRQAYRMFASLLRESRHRISLFIVSST